MSEATKTTSSATNRRASRRVEVRDSIRIECRKGTLGLGRNILKATIDVSESGIRVVVSEPLIKNDEAELCFQNMQVGHSVKRHARVIWSVTAEEGSCCAGLHFDKPLSYTELQSIARPPRLMT